MHVRDETKAPASFTLHNAFGCITLLFSVACVFQDLRPVVRHPCPCPRPSHATPTPRRVSHRLGLLCRHFVHLLGGGPCVPKLSRWDLALEKLVELDIGPSLGLASVESSAECSLVLDPSDRVTEPLLTG
jgi:hypothetical protein